MKLLFNDCSIDSGFTSEQAFLNSMRHVMGLRQSIRRLGRELHCAQRMVDAHVIPDRHIMQVIQRFGRDERTAFMQWLTKGPFWSDNREHGENDYLQCEGHDVTGCAIGEAAYHRFQSRDYRTVSPDLDPWCQSPLIVAWHESEHAREMEVPNYWAVGPLIGALEACSGPLRSWGDLRTEAQARYSFLLFAEDSFKSLSRCPFNSAVAEGLLLRLKVLDELMGATREDGGRTPEGHQLYQKHFTGSKAWFSDSSDREKGKFKEDMRFPHPTRSGETLFCSWHGKVGHPHGPLRLHFGWPYKVDGKLFIAYIGPKITKR